MARNSTLCLHDPANDISLLNPLAHLYVRGEMGQNDYGSVTVRLIYSQKKRLAEKIRAEGNNLPTTRGRHQNPGQ